MQKTSTDGNASASVEPIANSNDIKHIIKQFWISATLFSSTFKSCIQHLYCCWNIAQVIALGATIHARKHKTFTCLYRIVECVHTSHIYSILYINTPIFWQVCRVYMCVLYITDYRTGNTRENAVIRCGVWSVKQYRTIVVLLFLCFHWMRNVVVVVEWKWGFCLFTSLCVRCIVLCGVFAHNTKVLMLLALVCLSDGCKLI